MGLDNFWIDPNSEDKNTPIHIEGKFNLCGGILSGHDNTSFRGKVYNDIVEYITGISLYSTEISNEVIKLMAEKLNNFRYEDIEQYIHPPSLYSKEEYGDLQRMFQLHANAGHALIGWW